MKKKLSEIKMDSGFSQLSKESLSGIFGGKSCCTTGSSDQCDNTAICNCKMSKCCDKDQLM